MKIHRGTSLLERIWMKTQISEEGCWEWQGYKDKDGYGILTYNKKPVKLHRVIYELVNEDLGGLHALHTCDNPSCLRPSHIFAGTNADNTADKIEKGRARYAHGEESGNHYLTIEQVLAIRRDYENSDKKKGVIKAIAEKHNIRPHLAGRIIRRERWSWL